jgi:hypothetical protein
MTDEPDWDLLRDNPCRFFGLDEADFDRTDLKRAYNSWLRRYKPERAPEEFQQLRAAYETLDEELRYGSSLTRRSVPESRQEEPEPVSFDVVAELRERSAGEVLADLGQRAGTSARAHVQCALLAEELAGDDSLALLRRLADAARATSGDRLIAHWLHEACRDELSIEDAQGAIRILSDLVDEMPRGSALDAAWFDRTTEPLWTRLIAELEFAEFLESFDATSTRRRDASGFAHAVLLFRLVRRGLFRADEDWIAAQFAELEHLYHQLPGWYRDELDVFFWLDRYRADRADFLNGNPARDAIDRCVQAILRGDVREADRECFRLFADVRTHRDALFAALPAGENFETALSPIMWYAGQLEDRHMRAVESDDEPFVAERVRPFVEREEHIARKSWEQSAMGYLNLLRYIACFAAGAGVFALAWFLAQSSIGLSAIGVIFFMSIFLWKQCYLFLTDRVDVWLIYPQRLLCLRLYRRRLRPATERFFESSRLDFSAVVRELRAEGRAGGVARNILEGQVPSDWAMSLCALSHQFSE